MEESEKKNPTENAPAENAAENPRNGEQSETKAPSRPVRMKWGRVVEEGTSDDAEGSSAESSKAAPARPESASQKEKTDPRLEALSKKL